MTHQNDTFKFTNSYLSHVAVVKMPRDSLFNTSFSQCLLLSNNISQQSYLISIYMLSFELIPFFFSDALALFKNSDVLIVRSCKHYKKRMDSEALAKLLPRVHIRVTNWFLWGLFTLKDNIAELNKRERICNARFCLIINNLYC